MAIHGVGRMRINEHLQRANGRASSNSPSDQLRPWRGLSLVLSSWRPPIGRVPSQKPTVGRALAFSSHKAVGQSVLLGDWPMGGLLHTLLCPKGRMSKGEYISPRDMAPHCFMYPWCRFMHPPYLRHTPNHTIRYSINTLFYTYIRRPPGNPCYV